MSKYKAITTRIANPGYICQALEDMGIPYETAGEEELTLYGYRGDARQQTGAVVVRRQHIGSLSNDLGWSYDPETGVYNAIVSEYDQTLQRVTNIVSGVAQRCALLKLQELATLNGFDLEVEQDEQGVQRVLIGGVK